ncbi:hypothetical protein SBC2_73250 (plasmid) [Caballeronia sp. SBC2]|nr:hypothetical protein SBC2_73250 [Caballeronia sp. SBC2]
MRNVSDDTAATTIRVFIRSANKMFELGCRPVNAVYVWLALTSETGLRDW